MRTKTMMTVGTALALVLAVGLAGCSKAKESETPPKVPATGGAKVVQTEYLNTVCPMMDNPIDPAKVTEALTREHKGGKVAFCCAMCTGPWDKLTEEQRDAALLAAAEGAKVKMPAME